MQEDYEIWITKLFFSFIYKRIKIYALLTYLIILFCKLLHH